MPLIRQYINDCRSSVQSARIMAKIPYFANKKRVTKRYIKFLQVNKDPSALRATLKNAPDSVIKTICNIALNAQQGDVAIRPFLQRILRRHKNKINALISQTKSLKTKRRLLQHGGFAFLPALLAAVLPTLGGLVFDKILNG